MNKEAKVVGQVTTETDKNRTWKVNVYLLVDDNTGEIIEHRDVEFGAAPQPKSGTYTLTFEYNGQRHETYGHRIKSKTWRDQILGK